MLTKKIGVPFRKETTKLHQENVVSFENVKPADVKIASGKPTRPVTAFSSDRVQIRQ